jgi:DNA-binding CsgD family transcriptional regulator
MTAPQPHPDPVALLGSATVEALGEIDIPVYVLDLAGKLRWANPATTKLIGKRCGDSYLSFVAADSRDRAKDHFARKIVGGFSTTYEIAVIDHSGRRVPLKVRGAPLRSSNRVVGILGLAVPIDDGLAIGPDDERPLTPRQVEILLMLAEAASTETMASRLGIATETVHNHLRGLFRRLDVHNRLEAVAAARRRGLLKESDSE